MRQPFLPRFLGHVVVDTLAELAGVRRKVESLGAFAVQGVRLEVLGDAEQHAAGDERAARDRARGREAQQAVLDNIKQTLGAGWKALVEDLRSLTGPVSLRRFLTEADVDLTELYAGGDRGWTKLRRQAGHALPPPTPNEASLARAIGRLLHVNDPERFRVWRALLDHGAPPPELKLNHPDHRLLYMLASILDTQRRPLDEQPAVLADLLANQGEGGSGALFQRDCRTDRLDRGVLQRLAAFACDQHCQLVAVGTDLLPVLQRRVDDRGVLAAPGAQRVQRTGPDEPLHDLLGQLRARHQIGQRYTHQIDLLAQRGVVVQQEQYPDIDEEWPLIERAVLAALADCARMREQEGQALKAELNSRLEDFSQLVQEIETSIPQLVAQRHQELKERIAKLLADMELDPAAIPVNQAAELINHLSLEVPDEENQMQFKKSMLAILKKFSG